MFRHGVLVERGCPFLSFVSPCFVLKLRRSSKIPHRCRWSQWAEETVYREALSGSAEILQWKHCQIEECIRHDDDMEITRTEGCEEQDVSKCALADLREAHNLTKKSGCTAVREQLQPLSQRQQ